MDNKYCQDKIINDVLCSLDNNIYLSEADFQFNFAQKLDKVLKSKTNNDYNIVLEYPFLSKDLYGTESEYCQYKKDNKIDKDRSYIDLFFEYENKKYFIEFKYKTAQLSVNKYNAIFNLCTQGAYPDNKYYILEDIERLEQIECENKYLIFLTNDSYYWGGNNGNNSNKYQLTGNLKLENNCYEYSNKRPLKICNNYKFKWITFNEVNNENHNRFQVLIIRCKNRNK